MKPEYQVLHRPNHDNEAEDPVAQFDNLDAAMAYAGFPNVSDWRSTQSGSVACTGTPGRALEWEIIGVNVPETDAERIEVALDLAAEYGQTDGNHHKAWVIDQMVRHLTGDRYEQWVARYRTGEGGPETYTWDEGVAP